MLVKTGRDISIAKLSEEPDLYIVPENEKHLYHVIIEVKKFDGNTGARQSIPRVQKFGLKTYETTIADELRKQGYTLIVLHNPNTYLADKKRSDYESKIANQEALKQAKEKALKDAADALALKQANEKAESERIAQEQQAKIDKAVADALADQKKDFDDRFAKMEKLITQSQKTETAKAKTETDSNKEK